MIALPPEIEISESPSTLWAWILASIISSLSRLKGSCNREDTGIAQLVYFAIVLSYPLQLAFSCSHVSCYVFISTE